MTAPAIFASKSPRDLNADKKPWSCTSCGDRFVREQPPRHGAGHDTVYRPRPKFDHV